MLTSLRSRLRRLQESVRERTTKSEDQDRRLAMLLANDHLRMRPELVLVQAADTDAATFREIQTEVARARGDFGSAERLERERPYDGPRLPGRGASRTDEVRAFTAWHNDLVRRVIPEHIWRERAAVEAARMRLKRNARRPGAR